MVIDWSALNSRSPVRASGNAIWLAKGSTTGAIAVHYFRTRELCYQHVEEYLVTQKNERVLVCWDFNFGYPMGLAEKLGLKGNSPWREVWNYLTDRIEDDARNKSNRFSVASAMNREISEGPGPFWGVPPSMASENLTSRRNGIFEYPVAGLEEWRHTENENSTKSVWQLLGNGSVGSQALVGIPRVNRLLHHEQLEHRSRAWPFDQINKGGDAGAIIVHTEIYPSAVPFDLTDNIRDRAQVKGYVEWLQIQQRDGALRELMNQPWGDSSAIHKRVTQHEGWILGSPVF